MASKTVSSMFKSAYVPAVCNTLLTRFGEPSAQSPASPPLLTLLNCAGIVFPPSIEKYANLVDDIAYDLTPFDSYRNRSSGKTII